VTSCIFACTAASALPLASAAPRRSGPEHLGGLARSAHALDPILRIDNECRDQDLRGREMLET